MSIHPQVETETKVGSCCSGAAQPVAKEGATNTDPVCGMAVDPAKTPWRYEKDGKTHAFCSAHCRDAFVAQGSAHHHGVAHGVASGAGAQRSSGEH